jgi:FtsP/CotA-like multicopper oxidase with cupredoxin domain
MGGDADAGEKHAEDLFTTETEALEWATLSPVEHRHDGATLDLNVLPVRKRIGESELRMLGYNGSIPGPTLHVDQGSEITVHVTNQGDLETTVHWHGLRLENRFDGVPHETQQPIPIGGSFTYRIQFPDAGFYWYHPHIREDFGQELGLYGTIIVEPAEADYWPPADRHVALTLDDVLIEEGRIAPFRRHGTTHTAMGRFGNVMLIGGEAEFRGEARVGEVVRLDLVNTANTRLFNFGLHGERMKLIGGDSGRYEHETLVTEILLAPSERAIVDVLFQQPGEVLLEHRTPDEVYHLGKFMVQPAEDGGEGSAHHSAGDNPAAAAAAFARATSSDLDANESAASSHGVAAFEQLRHDPELTVIRRSLQSDLEREPDKILSFVSRMPLLYGDEEAAASSYVCPMHPEVTSSTLGMCPKCGMKLVPVPAIAASSFACPMHPEVTAPEPGTCPKCGMKLIAVSDQVELAPEPTGEPHAHEMGEHMDDPVGHAHAAGEHEHGGDGLEWEDLMPEINRATDESNMIWQIIDRETGAENAAIDWEFTVGDRVKIRLINEMESDHPMHHPFHVHGAGRFLILTRNGAVEPNLVWKDTVLLRAGETVDILLDVSNPGLWMAHCHIAEHMQTGMMFSFNVARREGGAEAASTRKEAA